MPNWRRIEGLGGWNLLPYQAYFLVQPELKTGAFLTIRDNGVNPIHRLRDRR